jgi:23S rRNA (cytosine1962-C5)-methyltransferase
MRKKVILKSKREEALLRRHPWVFSGAVHALEGDPADGDIVDVHSRQGQYLATGHYHEGSIRVRIFSYQPTSAELSFWVEQLGKARERRRRLGLDDQPHTNSYRLAHGEGDGLPGLIVDVYDRCAVVQCHTIGMHREREKIALALQAVYERQLQCIYDKSKDALPGDYAAAMENGWLLGNASQGIARENGHAFLVDWVSGQKTGFFLDQRDNRRLLRAYAPQSRALNAFCYTGGFSVYALAAGARHVDSVDASEKAIALATRNIALNQLEVGLHRAHVADVSQFLRQCDSVYDLMIVDPPAFAKSLDKRHNAVQGYKRLNSLAMRKIAPGGFLFTFSCSQAVDFNLFHHTIVAAALDAKRNARVLHRLSQAPDHPVNLFHPEGAYLKGLVLQVD